MPGVSARVRRSFVASSHEQEERTAPLCSSLPPLPKASHTRNAHSCISFDRLTVLTVSISPPKSAPNGTSIQVAAPAAVSPSTPSIRTANKGDCMRGGAAVSDSLTHPYSVTASWCYAHWSPSSSSSQKPLLVEMLKRGAPVGCRACCDKLELMEYKDGAQRRRAVKGECCCVSLRECAGSLGISWAVVRW